MRAAAEFHGNAVERAGLATHLHQTHHIAVLIAEELADFRVLLDFSHRVLIADHGQVLVNPLVHQHLHAAQVSLGDSAAVHVETQAVGIHQGALLGDILAHQRAQRLVQQVRGAVVRFQRTAALHIQLQLHGVAHGRGHAIGHGNQMGAGLANLLHTDDRAAVAPQGEGAAIAHLATHFGIEGGLVRDDEENALSLVHFGHGGGGGILGVAGELGHLLGLEVQGAHHLLLLGSLGALALLLHELVEADGIHLQPALAGHEGGQVNRESVGIVQLEGEIAGNLAGGGHFLIEELQASVQRFVEAGFLTQQHLFDGALAAHQLGEHATHLAGQRIHQLAQEGFFQPQGAAIAHSAAQDAAQHIVAAVVAGQNTIRNGEAQRADVVGNHAEGHALAQRFLLLGGGVLWVDVHILATGNLLDAAEDGAEHVRAVIRHAAGEIRETPGALHHGAGTLEAHAGIHMAGRQRAEGTIALGIVLNEHEVPDFDALVAVAIHQAALRVALGGQVHVQLRAGAARAGLAHHPEIILHAAIHHVHLRVHALGGEEGSPGIVGLLVKLTGVALGLIRGIHGGIQALHGESPALHDELPGPGDGLFLEIVTERPVTQHFEEGMVVGILAHILQVIVLATGADALLRVGSASGFPRRGPHTQEIRYKLVHACVREQQARALRHE